MNPKWTAEETEFIREVAEKWASGMTQEQIGASYGKSIGGIRYDLVKLGVKFGRAGKLVWLTNREPVEIPIAA